MRVKRVQCTQKVKISRETAYRLPLFLPSLLITCRDGCASAILARMMSGTLAKYVPGRMRFRYPGTYDERYARLVRAGMDALPPSWHV